MSALRPLLLALLAGAALAVEEPVRVGSSSRVSGTPQPETADQVKRDLDAAQRELATLRDQLASAHGEIDGLRQRVAELERAGDNGVDRASVSAKAAADLQKACDALSAAAKAEIARLKDARDEAGHAAADQLERAAKALSAAAASLRGQTPTTSKGE